MALDRGSRKDGCRECVENETLCIEHLGDSEEENEGRRKVGKKKLREGVEEEKIKDTPSNEGEE